MRDALAQKVVWSTRPSLVATGSFVEFLKDWWLLVVEFCKWFVLPANCTGPHPSFIMQYGLGSLWAI